MTTSHPHPKRSALRRRRPVLLLVALLALTASALPIPAASAQDASVLVEGLHGPQGVFVASDGTVWVTETGAGGDEILEIFDTETAEVVEAGFGISARVLRVDPATGAVAEVAVMPSVRTPMGGFGGGRLIDHDGTIYASVGEWATPEVTRPANIGTIVSIDTDGAMTEVADLWAHEIGVNPYDIGGPHSHPYGLAVGPDGRLLVADAGGNALLAVDPATGGVETVAVFDPLPGVFPRPDYGGEMLTDPVPTAVVVQGDRVFVSLLSGAPFVPGSAKVVEIHDDGTFSDHATGLMMLTDLREGPDGNLYATTFAIFGEEGPSPASGSVVRILPDGTHESAAEGLSFVTSLDFDDDGNAYVATNGVGPPGSGQVVVLDGLAAPAAQELPRTGPGQLTVALTIVALTALAAGVLLVRFRIDAA